MTEALCGVAAGSLLMACGGVNFTEATSDGSVTDAGPTRDGARTDAAEVKDAASEAATDVSVPPREAASDVVQIEAAPPPGDGSTGTGDAKVGFWCAGQEAAMPAPIFCEDFEDKGAALAACTSCTTQSSGLTVQPGGYFSLHSGQAVFKASSVGAANEQGPGFSYVFPAMQGTQRLSDIAAHFVIMSNLTGSENVTIAGLAISVSAAGYAFILRGNETTITIDQVIGSQYTKLGQFPTPTTWATFDIHLGGGMLSLSMNGQPQYAGSVGPTTTLTIDQAAITLGLSGIDTGGTATIDSDYDDIAFFASYMQ